jgi:hypothetical protein
MARIGCHYCSCFAPIAHISRHLPLGPCIFRETLVKYNRGYILVQHSLYLPEKEHP